MTIEIIFWTYNVGGLFNYSVIYFIYQLIDLFVDKTKEKNMTIGFNGQRKHFGLKDKRLNYYASHESISKFSSVIINSYHFVFFL